MAGLLEGLRVADLTDDRYAAAGQLAGRILADLGADVVLVEPADGSPARRDAHRFALWNAGKRSVVASADQLAGLLNESDVVLAYRPPEAGEAEDAVWVAITPYGLSGPRAQWRGSDLMIVAASGNVYATGDPDRPPLRCTEPTSAAHAGPEVAIAALTAVASGVPQLVDLSLHETVVMANMGGASRYPFERNRGRRRGAFTGRTRESWRCRDGWVSFGLRGGAARIRNLQTLTKLCVEAGVATPAVTDRDWSTYDHRRVSDEELTAISDVVQRYFDQHTMAELYDVAVRTGLMLAPANSAREIAASEQLRVRDFFTAIGELRHVPRTFAVVEPDRELITVRGPAPPVGGATPSWPSDALDWRRPVTGDGAWAGLRILELGSGAAGPLATGYFADYGATVVRLESVSRPDFLRSYTVVDGDPDGSAFFAVLNAGKLDVTIDLKHPDARPITERLVEWADVVADNFAPGAMDRLGLDRATLRRINPNVILASTCLQGQTGPHRDYPGFGGQGAALSGYTNLTGWPDRAPVGPAGTITDSLAPRFTAAAIAAALLDRRRTGQGVDIDLSQVEAAVWTLSPWIAAWTQDGEVLERIGNRHRDACPHGVFPAAGDDRWVALAVWSDDEWRRLADIIGVVNQPGFDTVKQRQDNADEVEALVGQWTCERAAADIVAELQAAGLDAAPVPDWADLLDDPQLAARQHFVRHDHPVLADQLCEQRGFRLSQTPGGPAGAGPTLGQHTVYVLENLLGLSRDDVEAAVASGAVSVPTPTTTTTRIPT